MPEAETKQILKLLDLILKKVDRIDKIFCERLTDLEKRVSKLEQKIK